MTGSTTLPRRPASGSMPSVYQCACKCPYGADFTHVLAGQRRRPTAGAPYCRCAATPPSASEERQLLDRFHGQMVLFLAMPSCGAAALRRTRGMCGLAPLTSSSRPPVPTQVHNIHIISIKLHTYSLERIMRAVGAPQPQLELEPGRRAHTRQCHTHKQEQGENSTTASKREQRAKTNTRRPDLQRHPAGRAGGRAEGGERPV